MFADISSTRVAFKLQQKWNPEYAKPRSPIYNEIQASMTAEVGNEKNKTVFMLIFLKKSWTTENHLWKVPFSKKFRAHMFKLYLK